MKNALELATRIVNSLVSDPDLILLPARGDTDNYLERVEGNKWRLVSQYENTRFGFTDDGEVEFCDPTDGPFMSLGYIIGDYMVTKIEVDKEIILTLEHGSDTK